MKLNKDYNIILVNLDGLRRDKVERCPELELLKKQSFYFSNMDTVAPYTFTSLHAIFSGTYPSKNGVNAYYNIFNFKKNEITTLAQTLQQCGYYTCCDVISESVSPKQGYDEYKLFDEKTINFNEHHKELIMQLSKKKKFFLFLHYTEIHKNLVRDIVQKYKKEAIDDEYYKSQKENEERYNSYMPSCNDYVATILETVKRMGISENTVIIFFSDHGTSIGEKKGEKFYGVFLYEYTLNVFCIMHIPGQISKIIDKECRTIDLFSTILEISQYPSNKISQQIQGESLFELINNPEADDRELFAETGGLYGPWPSPKKHNVFCIKIKNKKLIYNDTPQTWEFYDLQNDPNELNNLINEDIVEIEKLKQKLIFYLNENNIITNLNS